MQVVLSSATLISFTALSALDVSPVTRYKLLQNVFWWFNKVFFGGRPVSAQNVIQGCSGSDVSHYAVDYSSSFAVRLPECLRLSDGDVGTFKVEFASNPEPVWHGFDKIVDVCISGLRDTRTIDPVLHVPLSPVLTVCDWKLII